LKWKGSTAGYITEGDTMNKSIILLTIVSLISSQTRPCSPAVAVAGTALVGAVAAANVYRVYRKPEGNRYDLLSRQDRVNWAIGLGLVATMGAGYMLHQTTPMARLSNATKLLTVVKTNPLLQHHHLIKTPNFVPTVQHQYASAGLPYAKAFRDLKESKRHSVKSIDLIHKARMTNKDSVFGQAVIDESIKNNGALDDLMLAVKEQPRFESQHLAYSKIKTDKEIAESAQIIAAAQVSQAVNSAFHRR